MTNDPSNPNLPHAIDEGDLLALIEGTQLPAERAARLREALASDPRLAELAALMRSDREVVASLPPASAPTDLLDRVEAVLEREALVGLARTEASTFSDSLPISTVVPPARIWIGRRTGGMLAAAAAVALIAGGVLMMIPGKRPAIAPPPPGPLANNDKANVPAKSNDLASKPGVDSTDNHETAPPIVIATKPPENENGTAIPDPTVAAKASPAPEFTAEKLLTAAKDGRLALRVRAEDLAVKTRVDAVNANARTLRLDPLDTQDSNRVTNAFKVAFASHRQPIVPIKNPIPSAEPPAVATGDPGNPRPTPPPVAKDDPTELHPEAEPVLSQKAYVAYIPAAIESLESLRKRMETTLPAEWIILAAPVSFAPPTDGSSILWWTTPPAAWSERFTVPVIVQHN